MSKLCGRVKLSEDISSDYAANAAESHGYLKKILEDLHSKNEASYFIVSPFRQCPISKGTMLVTVKNAQEMRGSEVCNVLYQKGYETVYEFKNSRLGPVHEFKICLEKVDHEIQRDDENYEYEEEDTYPANSSCSSTLLTFFISLLQMVVFLCIVVFIVGCLTQKDCLSDVNQCVRGSLTVIQATAFDLIGKLIPSLKANSTDIPIETGEFTVLDPVQTTDTPLEHIHEFEGFEHVEDNFEYEFFVDH